MVNWLPLGFLQKKIKDPSDFQSFEILIPLDIRYPHGGTDNFWKSPIQNCDDILIYILRNCLIFIVMHVKVKLLNCIAIDFLHQFYFKVKNPANFLGFSNLT